MNITVNDQTQQYPNPINIAQLLDLLGLSGRPVAVELNQDLVPKAQHDETWLKDGDCLEVVSLTGGG